jgi:SAM-dependent methyltransferase
MFRYRLMYRVGLTPWERRPVPETWSAIVEGPEALPPGRALDIGCGTGRDAVHLAQHGWRVTAVDSTPRALELARERARREGVEVDWRAGDVTDLGALGLEPGYGLVYDFGCIHGLEPADRDRALGGLAGVAAPRAALLIVAFKAGRRRLLPRGMDRDEVVRGLGAGWELIDTRSVLDDSSPRPIRKAEPTLYRFRRAAA